jgi:hypothetical protein
MPRRFPPPWSIDEGMESFTVKDATGQPKILPRLGGRFILHKSLNQRVRPNQREGVMVPVISANALLVWFVWGFFMAIGWALGTWVVARLLGMVWRERP